MKKKVMLKCDSLIGEVLFWVVDKGFNYVLWMYEVDYNFGLVLVGVGGINGYLVGNKYLECLLKGEL